MKGNHSSSRLFQVTDVAPHGRSLFDLSHLKLLSGDFGLIYPCLLMECVPGDFFKIGIQMLIRFQPLVAPIMHEVNAYVHYFFVPYRLLWPKPIYEEYPLEEPDVGDWETFITGGIDGTDTSSIPHWDDTDPVGYTPLDKSIWDYMGFPMQATAIVPASQPICFPKRAYNLIWNEFYRDETLSPPVSLNNEGILPRAWEKDYFTSALLWQQRGVAPAFPVTIGGFAEWETASFLEGSSGYGVTFDTTPNDGIAQINDADALTSMQNFMNSNTLNTSTSTFDVADMRLAFQIQKFLERNARSGVRYTEFLQSHFGVHPRDDRLQRPEYIGGIKTPIIVSEVLQTSSTTGQPTPQANMAGHGITVEHQFVGSYKVQEFGVIVGMLSVMPRAMYQNGLDRAWSRRTRYDFYFPEFAHLSEQAVLEQELYLQNAEADNEQTFGYQGRYDELRFKKSEVTSDFRDTFDYWHLGRIFDAPPDLTTDFIYPAAGEIADLKRIFAIPAVDGMLMSVGNIIEANRPLPAIPIPGLIDH